MARKQKSKISDEDLLSMLQNWEQDASQYATGDLRAAREQLTREFYQRPYGNEEPGWSDYVSSATADTIEWMLPGILAKFITTDKAVEFKPTRKLRDPLAQGRKASSAARVVPRSDRH
jgi:hypothetical protein